MLKLILRHFGRFSVFKFLNSILFDTLVAFRFSHFKINNFVRNMNGLSVTRSFWVFCPIGPVWDRQPPLWWQAWSSMDITSHGAFFASTRNSWMGPFRPIFASVLFKLILKERNRSGTSLWPDLFQRRYTSESSATKYALCALSRENSANVQNKIYNYQTSQ